MVTGRPRVYDDSLELEQECDKYFIECDEIQERPTVTGLALHLGFASKQSLYDYEKNKYFSYPIKKSLLKIENSLEKKLDQQAVAGIIFALKNMGWVDKIETGFTDKSGDDILDITKLPTELLQSLLNAKNQPE